MKIETRVNKLNKIVTESGRTHLRVSFRAEAFCVELYDSRRNEWNTMKILGNQYYDHQTIVKRLKNVLA